MKSTLLSENLELPALYKALAHPIRLAIIEKLLTDKTCSCNDFVAVLPFAQATISEHLRKLRQARLIVMLEKGTKSEYSLNEEQLRHFIREQEQRIKLRHFS